MKKTFIFLVINYLLVMLERLYSFNNETLFWDHYSIIVPLSWFITPICTLVFLFSKKWRYAICTVLLHVAMLLWINHIGPFSTHFFFGTPLIEKRQGYEFYIDVSGERGYDYIVTSPPKSQRAFTALIADYFSKHPLGNKDYSGVLYIKSIDTMSNGKIAKAHWWDQPMRGRALIDADISEYEIATVANLEDGSLKIWFIGGYGVTCENNQSGNVIIKPDGTHTPTCD
ncbi:MULTISPECIES: hypothetical protein [Lonsdalea]|uniref:Uncharacterized protein n=2 Tax=Lonsdalea TaxID=1082702 RepID=A0AAD0WJG5_9GAMM|nr:hypothetical protein [Lonsdalea britannica]AXW85700.1 hypothetical protein CKQ53_01005 [Lonsdalea britannica]OSM93885.1 hypothetical protein AU509_16715 [Lonsdalea britannica]